jgi:hypothetical protein
MILVFGLSFTKYWITRQPNTVNVLNFSVSVALNKNRIKYTLPRSIDANIVNVGDSHEGVPMHKVFLCHQLWNLALSSFCHVPDMPQYIHTFPPLNH